MGYNLPIFLDLHGLTVHQGYNKTLMFVKLHWMDNTSNVKIITGASGKMNNEFEKWAVNPAFKPYIKSYKQTDNKGAWLVRLNN